MRRWRACTLLVASTSLLMAACTTVTPKRTTGSTPARQLLIPPPRASVVQRRQDGAQVTYGLPSRAPAPDSANPGELASLKMSEELQGLAPPEDAIVEHDGPPDPRDIPPNLDKIPDPVPVFEPLSAGGNKPNYEVLGQSYKVMNSARSYRETGLASWYGTKFHGKKTSNGEVYDMFELTAAHKQLPLPTYVRITNLSNGKSVIVRVNDRGPFHPGRVIDLSYAAAVRLGSVDKIAMVELEAITPGDQLPPAPKLQVATPAKAGARLLQVGAYSDPINAMALREELSDQGFKPVQVRTGTLSNGDRVHRVLIGPFPKPVHFEKASARLRVIGYQPVPVADAADPVPAKSRPTRTARR